MLKYNYSHEELHFPDEDGRFYRDYNFAGKVQREYQGQCFSSTTRGDSNGVRFAPAADVLGKHPTRWHFIEFEVEDDDYRYMLGVAETLVGSKYDYLAVSTGLGFQRDDNFYCSEVCNLIKSCAEVEADVHPISPRRSASIMAKKYGEPKGI